MREVMAVLRGGPSSEYEVSLKSGAAVLEALDRERYEPRDIFISKSGEWHLHGLSVTPERALREVSVVLNVVHGEYGEDGQMQELLDALGVPYAGSGASASALTFDKARTREEAARLGVKIPYAVVVDSAKISNLEKTAFNLFRSLPHPVMVKPIIGGSSVGMSKVEHFGALPHALEHAFTIASKALVEEYIVGKEAAVGVIDNFRNEKTYALLPVEIIPPPHAPFFDYDSKYSDETIERVPGRFSNDEKRHLMTLARLLHEGLGLSHYSRSDFIVSKRGIYFLEVNSLPGLTKESIIPKALHAVGASFSHFLDHLIGLVKKK